MTDTTRIVPDWAYDIDVYSAFEYFDDEESDCTGLPWMTLPSIAQQWKDDMTKRCAAMIKHGVATHDDFRWRAPEAFIKTGRWPADMPRPHRSSVASTKASG